MMPMPKMCVFCRGLETAKWHSLEEVFDKTVCGGCYQKWQRCRVGGMTLREWTTQAMKGNIYTWTITGPQVAKTIIKRLPDCLLEEIQREQVANSSTAGQQQAASGSDQQRIVVDESQLDVCKCGKCDLSDFEKRNGEELCCRRCGTKTYGNGKLIQRAEYKNNKVNPLCPACYQYNADTGHARPICPEVRTELRNLRRAENARKKREEMQKSQNKGRSTTSSEGSEAIATENADDTDKAADEQQAPDFEHDENMPDEDSCGHLRPSSPMEPVESFRATRQKRRAAGSSSTTGHKKRCVREEKEAESETEMVAREEVEVMEAKPEAVPEAEKPTVNDDDDEDIICEVHVRALPSKGTFEILYDENDSKRCWQEQREPINFKDV